MSLGRWNQFWNKTVVSGCAKPRVIPITGIARTGKVSAGPFHVEFKAWTACLPRPAQSFHAPDFACSFHLTGFLTISILTG